MDKQNEVSAPATLRAIDDVHADHVLDTTPEATEELSTMIESLDLNAKLSMKALAEKMNEIIEKVNSLESTQPSGDTVRDIKSDRAMDEDDARRVLLGDLKDTSTKEAALELGLSYGQVYSCRKGFTFKKVYKEFREANAE